MFQRIKIAFLNNGNSGFETLLINMGLIAVGTIETEGMARSRLLEIWSLAHPRLVGQVVWLTSGSLVVGCWPFVQEEVLRGLAALSSVISLRLSFVQEQRRTRERLGRRAARSVWPSIWGDFGGPQRRLCLAAAQMARAVAIDLGASSAGAEYS